MLIEALVGILIFSIGILAMIGMQGVAMKNTTDARYRSEAAFLATQIIGQMWVDRTNLGLYAAAGYAPRDNWVSNVAATLPGINVAGNVLAPTIAVDTTGAPPRNEVTVTIRWLQPGETQSRKFEMLNRINGAV